jgi:hypothetical protein
MFSDRRLPMTQHQHTDDVWWAALPMLPVERESDAYLRLRRVWHDSTRFLGRKPADPAAARRHEFTDPHHETNLTTTLWENFALFDPANWLPPLAAAVGWQLSPPVCACRWNYEWHKIFPPGHRPSKASCDVVIHVQDAGEQTAVLVVEAKNLGVKELGNKDRQPSYYLDIGDLIEVTARRHLIYCVDAACKDELKAQVTTDYQRWGMVTWQWLAALQIKLAWQLDAPEPVRRFVAGAIQYQYCQHGMVPDELALPWLTTEPTQHDVQAQAKGERQTTEERTLPLWRLGS